MENFDDFHRSFSDLKVLVGRADMKCLEIYLILNSTGTKRKKKEKPFQRVPKGVHVFFF